MKFFRFGPKENERPGAFDANNIARDISKIVNDVSAATIRSGSLTEIGQAELSQCPVAEIERYAPCVKDVGKIVAIGLNYSDHAAELDLDLPSEPVMFMKATSAICGPNDNLELPTGSTKTDWEVELGVVMGKAAKNVRVEDALDHVFGYCVVNDVSEREFQLERDGQWVKGKSADTFAPIGPWLVTADEVPDPQNLEMTLNVNGRSMQSGSTSTMVFGVAEVVASVSRYMSLQPGDLITTGTPPGVGMSKSPTPQFLRAGDVVEAAVEGLGAQKQSVVSC